MSRLHSWITSLKVRSVRFVMALTVAATGFAFVSTSGIASASNQFCTNNGGTNGGTTYNHCLNAWGGGPSVNVYGQGAANNQFNVVPNGSYWNIKFAGSGLYNGACISDALNDQNNARAGLVSCGGANGTPWGANDLVNNCYPPGWYGYQFENVHWTASIGPRNPSNGEPFYLNKPNSWCFAIL
ncbi:MAG TPA: hypothetical protein VLG47_04675 [Candidatus Saccharimonadales bacterium]|nr:hypothetical protein [Candidatus Saccharimonadales bacterium]